MTKHTEIPFIPLAVGRRIALNRHESLSRIAASIHGIGRFARQAMEGALSSLDTRNYDTDLDGGRSDESQMSVRIEEAETEGTIAEQAALAREKIAEGTYGVCDDCDEEIPIGRLEVIPYATRCAHCQTQEEQQPPQQELRKRRRYKVKQRER